jgi:outer membrane protein
LRGASISLGLAPAHTPVGAHFIQFVAPPARHHAPLVHVRARVVRVLSPPVVATRLARNSLAVRERSPRGLCMKTVNQRLLVAAAAGSVALASWPFAAHAQDVGDWIVRARAVHLDSANKDDTGFGLTINNKVLPEIDITYFVSSNVAAELILTYPQKHTIHSSVVGDDIGSFKHLPPTLTLQYHVTSLGSARPYVGAGINYTNLSSVHFDSNVSALNLGVKHNSVGFALQAGIDVPIGSGWLLNADVKKVQIGTTIYSNGNSVGKFKVDPLLVALGVGKRF